jgi:hypothetical protein
MFRQFGSLLIPVGLIIGVITFLEGREPAPSVPIAEAGVKPPAVAVPQARLAAMTSFSFPEMRENIVDKPISAPISIPDVHRPVFDGPLVAPDEDTLERAAEYSHEGEEYLKDGDPGLAKEAFQAAVELLPNDPRANAGLKSAAAAEASPDDDEVAQPDIRPKPLTDGEAK